MKLSGLFLCFLVGISTCRSSSQLSSKNYNDLLSYTVELMSKHRESLEAFIPGIISSPPSPSYYYNQPRLDFINCDTCTAGITALKLARNLQIPGSIIKQVIVAGCVILQIVEYEVCRGAVHGFGGPVLKIIDDKPHLTTADICGTLIDNCGVPDPSMADWDITVDGNKPAISTPPLLPEGIPAAEILQFTDIHLDLRYKAGTDVYCDSPENQGCCRSGNGSRGSAGEFGDFRCSLPKESVNAIFDHAKATTSPKYIFLTGDYIHSAIWQYSVAENTPHFEYVTTKLAATFPGVQIFPLVGNHEPHVVNMFAPENLWPVEEFDMNWMYNVISKPFNLPGQALATFKKGGFYTIKPDSASPFRVVALNTNLCYLQNFWLVYDTKDPTGQLQWLADTLDAAEKAREIVYIIGHIKPASGSCWKIWSQKYARIINRYEAIIKAQFFGHAHRESYNLAFDGDRPISLSYISPSMLTDGGNPAYKVFYVDGARDATSATWEIMDQQTWILNLEESNAQKVPVIESLYKAKEYFGMESLRPEGYYNFVKRMITDDALFQKYWRAHHRGSPVAGPCNNMECRWGYLCDMMQTTSDDVKACDRIKPVDPTAPTDPPPPPTTPSPEETTPRQTPPPSETPDPQTSTQKPTTTTQETATGSSSGLTSFFGIVLVQLTALIILSS